MGAYEELEVLQGVVEEAREVCKAAQSELDEVALPLLVEYAKSERVPCGLWPTQRVWWEAEVGEGGIAFVHNCYDHGYPTDSKEFVTIPRDFVEARARWIAEREACEERQREYEKAQRRTAYEQLRAEFGGS